MRLTRIAILVGILAGLVIQVRPALADIHPIADPEQVNFGRDS
jgi:hypothetical protein